MILWLRKKTSRFAHTLLVLGRSTKVLANIKVPPPLNFTFILHSLNIFNKSLILPPPLNFHIHWRSSIRVNSPTGVKLLYSLKIFIDDDDDYDVVERTRTGPSAVRSDLELQVNHNA